MTGERRMILAAVLLAVAQQKAENVKWVGVSPSRVKHISAVIAEEARLFVASSGFDEMCTMIEADTERLRTMEPKDALALYQTVTADNFNGTEVL